MGSCRRAQHLDCVAAAIIALAALTFLAGCDDDPRLPELGAAPDFTLVDQGGQPFRSADLRGNVWIANFIFTSCPSVCPMLTSQLKNIQRDLAEYPDLRAVSFTVDPAVDTPERLAEYAARYHADHERWTFVTGDPSYVDRVIEKGFKIGVGVRADLPGGGYDIMHGRYFVLVDRAGRIRGFYPSDADGRSQLVEDAETLLAEGKPSS